jgi:hypothetical protein
MSSASSHHAASITLFLLGAAAGVGCNAERSRSEERPALNTGAPEESSAVAAPGTSGVDAGELSPLVLDASGASEPTRIVWQRISEGLDGLTWTDERRDFARGISGVAYGNGIWVALGETQGQDNVLRWATSSDGVHWTPASQVLPEGYSSVYRLYFAQGRFVLLERREDFSGDAANFIYTSPDAVSWSARAMPSGALGGFGMASDGRRTVGAFGGGNIWTSTDLARWSAQGLAGEGESAGTIDVAFDGGRWVASMGVSRTVDSRYQEEGRLFTSADGQTWLRADVSGAARFQIEYAGGVWLALNDASEHLTSSDGITFQAVEPTGAWRAQAIPWLRSAGDRFITTYVDLEQVPPSEVLLLSSSDGVAWSDFGAFPGMPLPEDALNIEYSINDVAYADCRYVVVGSYNIQIPGALDPPLFSREIGPLLLTAEACPLAR